jgi:hypothetical protein
MPRKYESQETIISERQSVAKFVKIPSTRNGISKRTGNHTEYLLPQLNLILDGCAVMNVCWQSVLLAANELNPRTASSPPTRSPGLTLDKLKTRGKYGYIGASVK